MNKSEKHKIINAIIYPALFVSLMVIVFSVQSLFKIDIPRYGVFPRKLSGLIGVITSPLIHGGFNHLFNNATTLLILGSALFYFYKEIALKVTIWIYLMVGLWTWVWAREAYHIGASGLLYGIFSFLLVSGFLRRNKSLISLSFAVIFFYGSLVWGIFPVDLKISFEGHLWGFVAGIILAFYYRNQGPQEHKYVWPEDDLDDEYPYWKEGTEKEIKPPTTEINYIFKPSKKEQKD